MIPRRSPHNFRNYFVARAFKNSSVESEDLSQEDIIIVVMGPTGSGKSTFIETITGFPGIVGHGLQSFTNKISVYKISFPDLAGSDIHFVDTPGFDDTNTSDVDIFKMISDWLHNTYRRKIQVTGLLYFHRISDNRMAGTALKNLKLFESLCGPDFNKIVLTTTMWDEVDEWTGNSREEELQDTYWKPMVTRGSSVRRFLHTRPSAFEVLEPILGTAIRRKALLLQREVEDLGLMLNETSAGQTLSMQLREVVHLHEEKLTRIRTDLQQPLSPAELSLLMDDYHKIADQLQKTIADANRMKTLTTSKPTKFRKVLGFFRAKTPHPRQEPDERIVYGRPSISDQGTEARSSLSSASPSPSLHGSSTQSSKTASGSSSGKSSGVSSKVLQQSPSQRSNTPNPNTFPTMSPAWGQFAHPSYQHPHWQQTPLRRSHTARPREHPTSLADRPRRAVTPHIDATRHQELPISQAGPSSQVSYGTGRESRAATPRIDATGYQGLPISQAGPSSQVSYGTRPGTPSQFGIRQSSQETVPPVPAFPWQPNSPR